VGHYIGAIMPAESGGAFYDHSTPLQAYIKNRGRESRALTASENDAGWIAWSCPEGPSTLPLEMKSIKTGTPHDYKFI
jgi:hypothetical protein